MKKIIEFQNVTLNCDDFQILQGISFAIAEGENCAILGPNGSGKSTLIKMINCEIYPSITDAPFKRKIFGEDAWNIAQLRTHLGVITNDLHTKFANEDDKISGLEAVTSGFFGTLGLFPHQEIGKQHLEGATKIMAQLGISNLITRSLGTMSTGELRKCLVARAMVHPIKAILLDEPTVGLDIRAQREFINFMRNLAKGGTTIILVTHHIEEIFDEITKIILVKSGKIYADGKKGEILNSANLSEVFDTDINLIEKNGNYQILI